MMNRIRAAVIMVMASVAAQAAEAPDKIAATLLVWQEQEHGVTPYPLRMLVTEGFLRTDQAEDGSGFLLFDRTRKAIYSISHMDRSILVMESEPVPDSAGPRPDVQVELKEDPDAPAIGPGKVTYYRLRDGDTLCAQASVVPGLLPDVVAALSEMRAILAGRQYRDLENMPEQYRTPCFLAAYVYDIDRHLRVGMPIQESIEGGMKRVLLDYRLNERMPSDLFVLPEGYRVEHIR